MLQSVDLSIQDRVLSAIKSLPRNASLFEAAERLCYFAAIEEGLKDAEEGRVVSHDEAVKRINEMISKWSGSNGQ